MAREGTVDREFLIYSLVYSNNLVSRATLLKVAIATYFSPCSFVKKMRWGGDWYSNKSGYLQLITVLVHGNSPPKSHEQGSVCNFQSMKSPVELNSIFSKFFWYINWSVISPNSTRQWTTWKRGIYVKSYCLFETIA